MTKYSDIAKKALRGKVLMSEGRLKYDPTHSERVDSELSKQLRTRNHSLGNHPIFPASDESHFEEKLISKSFLDTVKNFKRVHGVTEINNEKAKMDSTMLITQIIKSEVKHKEEIIALAVEMIRNEFDMQEDDVEIVAELTTEINVEKIRQNTSPLEVEDMEFDNHDIIVSANEEVYKRRFINAMIQGASMKTNHMFHMVQDELMDLDVNLPQMYSKLMTFADYSYLVNNDSELKKAGGVVRVKFPSKDGEKALIHVQAMTLPVLIHELVKGVMELISSHALPEDDKLLKYVLAKADFVSAETWDIRLGTPIWERFTSLIEPADFSLKHHVFQELIMLPVKEFNLAMREIMAGTVEGKKIIASAVKRIKDDFARDEFSSAMDNGESSSFGLDDLDNLDLDIFL